MPTRVEEALNSEDSMPTFFLSFFVTHLCSCTDRAFVALLSF